MFEIVWQFVHAPLSGWGRLAPGRIRMGSVAFAATLPAPGKGPTPTPPPGVPATSVIEIPLSEIAIV
jgi:hypothetical protein